MCELCVSFLSFCGLFAVGDCGYHLHSMQLQFRHPSTGSVVTIQAPIPDALKTPQELQQPDDLLV